MMLHIDRKGRPSFALMREEGFLFFASLLLLAE